MAQQTNAELTQAQHDEHGQIRNTRKISHIVKLTATTYLIRKTLT